MTAFCSRFVGLERFLLRPLRLPPASALFFFLCLLARSLFRGNLQPRSCGEKEGEREKLMPPSSSFFGPCLFFFLVLHPAGERIELDRSEELQGKVGIGDRPNRPRAVPSPPFRSEFPCSLVAAVRSLVPNGSPRRSPPPRFLPRFFSQLSA